MRRGELWVARAELYASKARPVLIIQSDESNDYQSVITCLVTSYEGANDRLRLLIEPTTENGLVTTSYLLAVLKPLHNAISRISNKLIREIGAGERT